MNIVVQRTLEVDEDVDGEIRVVDLELRSRRSEEVRVRQLHN